MRRWAKEPGNELSRIFYRRGAKSAEGFYTAARSIKNPLCLCVSVVKKRCELTKH
jgi:hypothetical protein